MIRNDTNIEDEDEEIDKEIAAFLDHFHTTEEKYLDRLAKLGFSSVDANAILVLSNQFDECKVEINEAISNYIQELFQESLPPDELSSQIAPDEHFFNFNFQFEKQYDKQYVRDRIATFLKHKKSGLQFDWYYFASIRYEAILRRFIHDLCGEMLTDFILYTNAISKIVHFELGLALDVYFNEYKIASAKKYPIPIKGANSKPNSIPGSDENNRTNITESPLESEIDSQVDSQLIYRQIITSEFYRAIDSNQFQIHYQPKFDLQSGEIAALEAGLRWVDPVRGLVPPSEFIDLAEELSITNQISDWVIREVCKNIEHWKGQGITVPRISIKVTPRYLGDPLFTRNLVETITEFNIEPQQFTLEITENLMVNHGENIEVALKEIKEFGFYLALDDFGTGYSALSYLKHYPFDFVKIDQSFIHHIIENPGDASIVNAVISMAHGMGIKVIAEGVENEAQCEYLSKNMCDYIQGNLVSKSLPAADVGELILSKYSLPEKLRRFVPRSRTILLVDDEPNILSSLKRLFRQEGYKILTAGSGLEGLELIKNNTVDVIISDQRMPVMTGVDFLRQAKELRPDTVRIVLSGYTELQSITSAINEGAIYKFLTKPWDDQQLREQILDAFKQKELIDQNSRLGLEIRTANQELAIANRNLQSALRHKEKQLNIGETSLEITQEALQSIPIPLMGLDADGMIAFANLAAEKIFTNNPSLLGEYIDSLLPNFSITASTYGEEDKFSLSIPGFDFLIGFKELGDHSNPKGKLLTFYHDERSNG